MERLVFILSINNHVRYLGLNDVNTLIPAKDVTQLQIKNSSTADKTDVTYFKYDRNFISHLLHNEYNSRI